MGGDGEEGDGPGIGKSGGEVVGVEGVHEALAAREGGGGDLGG